MRHGEIMNTGIILGSHNETMIPGFVQWPVAGKALAHFHTHGDDDPLYDSENFSVNDTLGCKEVQYLETPRGKILKHIPRDHVVMQYDRVLKMWLPLGNAQIIKSFLERK